MHEYYQTNAVFIKNFLITRGHIHRCVNVLWNKYHNFFLLKASAFQKNLNKVVCSGTHRRAGKFIPVAGPSGRAV
jgi:hypothetical protein